MKNYLRTTFDKLGVWSRLELALYVANHGGPDWLASLNQRETSPGEITLAEPMGVGAR